jgi:Tol biopolymer transport system component
MDERTLTLSTVPVGGGQATRLFTRPSPAAFGTYSPDGTAIVFRRTSFDGRDPIRMTSSGLWIADADGDNPRRLVRGSMSSSQINPEALWPVWSPDGTQIAYEPRYGGGVYVLNIRTWKKSVFGSGTEPSWLDNDTLILEALG